MSEHVSVLPLGTHEYGVEVREGHQTTEHRVVFSQQVLDTLELPGLDEREFVTESVNYLLQSTPSASLPHDIDLRDVSREDGGYIPEMRVRLTG